MKVDERLIQQLAECLKQAVHETRHIETAQIQIVGMEAIKRQAGPLWDGLATRVRETSEDFISQRIGPHDLLIPAGDGFLVVFAEPEGAPAKCHDLQHDLDAFYLGEEWVGGLSASVRRESIRAAVLMERLSRPAPASPSPSVAAPHSAASLSSSDISAGGDVSGVSSAMIFPTVSY